MVNRIRETDQHRRRAGLPASHARPSIRTRARQQTSKAAKGAGIGAAAGAVVGLAHEGRQAGERADRRRRRRARGRRRRLLHGRAGSEAASAPGRHGRQRHAQWATTSRSTCRAASRSRSTARTSTRSSISALDGVSMVLKEYDKTVIEVAGHTDSSGSDQYNQALSERRAQSVASYLRSHGVKQQRLITIGAGEAPSGRVERHRSRAAPRIVASR